MGAYLPMQAIGRELARAVEIEGEEARKRVFLGNVGRPAVGGGDRHRADTSIPRLRDSRAGVNLDEVRRVVLSISANWGIVSAE